MTLLTVGAYKQRNILGVGMTDFALARRNMIDGQLRPNRVTSASLLAAIADLPRERFLPEALRAVAYADDDVPLGGGRYLMEPMVLARLVQSLQARPTDKALVVASGLGYGAALLSRLVQSVVALEVAPELAETAKRTIRDLGIDNMQFVVGKLEAGVPASAPYDVILIEGAVREFPAAILDQLAEGGRLAAVTVAGEVGMGVAQLVVKQGGVASGRPMFDAGTPPLPGFSPTPRFTF